MKFDFWFSSSMIIQYYGSFNTFILLLLLLPQWSLWTGNFWIFFDFGNFGLCRFGFFRTSTFEILFSIFFFNDHSILWVIQYIHTTIAADSVIPLEFFWFSITDYRFSIFLFSIFFLRFFDFQCCMYSVAHMAGSCHSAWV